MARLNEAVELIAPAADKGCDNRYITFAKDQMMPRMEPTRARTGIAFVSNSWLPGRCLGFGVIGEALTSKVHSGFYARLESTPLLLMVAETLSLGQRSSYCSKSVVPPPGDVLAASRQRSGIVGYA